MIMDDATLLDSLPPLARLALAYAPASAKAHWLTALALDTKCAGIIRQAREPMLAQLRLAWWRDRLAQPIADRPKGEPLLGRLADWPGGGAGLIPLIDGWEALLAEPPMPEQAMLSFVDGRVALIAALADRLGISRESTGLRASRWAWSDLSLHLHDPHERAAASKRALAASDDPRKAQRMMRPLVILEQVSLRACRAGDSAKLTSPRSLFLAMRIGLLGY